MRQMNSPIFFVDRPDEATRAIAETMAANGSSQLIVLCDRNTVRECYPLLAPFTGSVADAKVCVLPDGEENKHLGQVEHVFRFLTLHNATRNTLLVNLGGGVVCDLGGFAAAIYKRGIPFVHLPTTLIAQADAAIGGKTGVNFQDTKNLIGTFTASEAVIIFLPFLSTLPLDHWRSGMGELFKYAMIGAEIPLDDLRRLNPHNLVLAAPIIKKACEFKQSVVYNDPYEKGYRKILNFGHTMGHAIESAALRSGLSISHGEAVAAGVVAEAYLSHVVTGFSLEQMRSAIAFYQDFFTADKVLAIDPESIISFLYHDKKSTSPGLIQPVLLAQDGSPGFDYSVTIQQCVDSLKYLAGCMK